MSSYQSSSSIWVAALFMLLRRPKKAPTKDHVPRAKIAAPLEFQHYSSVMTRPSCLITAVSLQHLLEIRTIAGLPTSFVTVPCWTDKLHVQPTNESPTSHHQATKPSTTHQQLTNNSPTTHQPMKRRKDITLLFEDVHAESMISLRNATTNIAQHNA
jgi:hypothetical protein